MTWPLWLRIGLSSAVVWLVTLICVLRLQIQKQETGRPYDTAIVVSFAAFLGIVVSVFGLIWTVSA